MFPRLAFSGQPMAIFALLYACGPVDLAEWMSAVGPEYDAETALVTYRPGYSADEAVSLYAYLYAEIN